MTSDWPDIPLMYTNESDLVMRLSQEEKNKEEKKMVGSGLSGFKPQILPSRAVLALSNFKSALFFFV